MVTRDSLTRFVAEKQARDLAACVDRDQARAEIDAQIARLDAEIERLASMTDEEFAEEKAKRCGR